MFLDYIAETENLNWCENKKSKSNTCSLNISDKKVLLSKPLTFMNKSGYTVSSLMKELKIKPEQLCVVYDDINLPTGRTKLSVNGSAGGHNGVQDIISRIGPDFKRLRIGVGADRSPNLGLVDFVLGDFTEYEKDLIQKIQPQVFDGLRLMIDKGVNMAMNTINRKSKQNESRN